jgi:hypothetical protein
MGIVVVGTLVLVWTDATSRTFVTFLTMGPDQPWRFSSNRCKSPSYEDFLFDHSFGNERRTLSLCFASDKQGVIPYQVVPSGLLPPPLVRTSPNAPPPRPNTFYYMGDPTSGEAAAYVQQREQRFVLTPQLEADARRGFASALWKARWEGLRFAAPFIFGALIFIWVFTAVIGWIIRGFAGAPRG